MLPNESIINMFTRMKTIINNVDALGRTYINVDTVIKILRSLPKTWEANVMAIREAKDLTKLSLEELIESLMTHEITMEKQELKEKAKEEFDKDNLDKFDSKFYVGIFLGYSSSSKAYRVYNNRTLCFEESIHRVFKETQNDKIFDIVDNINESVQHLSLNDKKHMEVNNKEMNKDQPSPNKQ